MNNKLLLSVLGLFVASNLIAQTSLSGNVTDGNDGEPILFGTVKLFHDDIFVSGMHTDFDGNYSFTPIAPGTYDLEISYVGYPTKRDVGIVVEAEKENRWDMTIQMEEYPEIIIDYPGMHHRVSFLRMDLIQDTGGKKRKVILVVDQAIEKVKLIAPNGKVIKRWKRLKIGEYVVRIQKYEGGNYIISCLVDGRPYEILLNVYEKYKAYEK